MATSIAKKPVAKKVKTTSTSSKKGVSPGKVILGTIAVASVGAGAFFAYQHFKGENDSSTDASQDVPSGSGTTSTPQKIASSTWKSGVFPIVKGMTKNNDVYALQMALLQGGGAAADFIKNSGGADGSYGNGLASALAAAGLPASIVNQAKLSEIINSISVKTGYNTGTTVSKTNIFKTGNPSSDIKNAVASNDVNNVVAALSQLKSVADYQAANNNGDGILFAGDFLRRTIVTKLLETFGNSDRAKIEAEFLRIGLKKNSNNVWSLQGLSGFGSLDNAKSIITTRPVYVSPKDKPETKVIVVADMVIGKEISRSNGNIDVMTIDNKIVVVPADSTKSF